MGCLLIANLASASGTLPWMTGAAAPLRFPTGLVDNSILRAAYGMAHRHYARRPKATFTPGPVT